MFSFPCMCVGGDWIVKEGLPISHFARTKIKATETELLQELEAAMEMQGKAEAARRSSDSLLHATR